MKFVMADRDLTEFDWVGFVGAWVLALGLLWLTRSGLAAPLAVVVFFAWQNYRRKRLTLPSE